MLKKNTSILLVVLLINFASALENLDAWNRNSGIANMACPLDDDPDDPTVLPYQGDCTRFIKCSYGVGYPLHCPKGLFFSKVMRRCESPRVANCDPNETTPKPNIGGGTCTFTYQAHPTDCSKALTCVDGVTSELFCPPGSLWDKSANKCSFLITSC